jgi:hypothetical protein
MDANDIDGNGVAGDNPADDTDLSGLSTPQWADRSPSGNNLDVDTGAPTYESDSTNAINGYPVINTSVAGHDFQASTVDELSEGIAYFVSRSTDTAGNNFLAQGSDYLYVGNSTVDSFGSYNGTSGYVVSTTPAIFNEPIMASWSVTTAGSQPTVGVLKTQTGTQRQVATYSAATDQGLPIDNFGSNMIGDYAEIIYYDSTKNAAEKVKIESYLAAKYGFTYHDASDTPADMVASDGTLMRDVSAAGDYTTRSFVIGQDEFSGILNTASTTNDTDDQVLSVSGASDQEDLEFVSFADNNKQKTTSVEVDLAAGGRVLMLSRSWMYQEFDSNGVDGMGTVDLTFDLTKQTALSDAGAQTSNYVLLIDSTADGDFGDSVFIESSTVSSGVVVFEDVSLENGYVISIAEPGPSIAYPFSEPLETVEFQEDLTLNNGSIKTDSSTSDTPMTLVLSSDTWATSVANAAVFIENTHYSVSNGVVPVGLTLVVRKIDSTTVELELTGAATANNEVDDSSFDLSFLADAFELSEIASYVLNSTKTIGVNFADPNSVNVEFFTDAATDASTNETTADNFTTIRVEGSITSPYTVDVVATGGTAVGLGGDYLFGSSATETVTIPAGTYDGTAASDIVIPAPVLNNDSLVEGNETIIFTMQNPSNAGVTIGDTTTDANATIESTYTYTVTDDDASGISGSLYAANRTTTLSGRVIRLLVNGADPTSGALFDETDAAGLFELAPIPASTYSANDILTVYIDDETENGATVISAGTDDADILSVSVYADHLRIMDDGAASALTNANLATAATGDADTSGTTSAPAGSTTDLSDLMVVTGSDLDLSGGVEIASGDTFAPGGNIALEGDFINLGTYTKASETITFDGTGNQVLASGGSSFNNIVNDAGADGATAAVSSTLTLSGALSVGGTFINEDGEILDINGSNLTVTGAFTNGTTAANETATVTLQGTETVTLTQDSDSGTFEYVGDGIANALSSVTINFGSSPDYYNLTVNDSGASNSDIFKINADVEIGNNLTITDSEFDTEGFAVDVNGDVVITPAGTLKARTSTINVAGGWANTGTYTTGTSTVILDATSDQQNVMGSTTFYNFVIANNASAKTIGFEEDMTQVVSGAFSADFETGQFGFIRTVDSAGTVLNDASQSTINVTGTLGVIDFVNVRDAILQESGATKSPVLDPSGGVDATNNLGWFKIPQDLDFTVLFEGFALNDVMDQTTATIELRSGTDHGDATTVVFSETGIVLDTTGGPAAPIDIASAGSGDFYIVVKMDGPDSRANHLEAITANKITFAGGSTAVDFADSGSGDFQAMYTQDSFTALATLASGTHSGKLALRGGNSVVDGNKLITVSDIQVPYINGNAFLCSSTNGACTWDAQWDLNGDNIVTAADLTTLISNFQRQSHTPNL